MSFAGHVLDSINRMKQNRAQVKRHRQRAKDLLSQDVHYHQVHEYQHLSEEEKQVIAKYITRQENRLLLKKVLLLIIVFSSVAVLIYMTLQKWMIDG